MNRIYKLVKNKRTGCLVVASELAKGCKKGSKLLRLTSLMTLLTAFSFQSFGSDYTIKKNNDPNISITKTYDKDETINLNDSTFGFDNIEPGKEVVKHEVSVNSKFEELYQIKYQNVFDAEDELAMQEKQLKSISTSYNKVKTNFDNAVNRFNTAEAALNKAKEELENATEEEKEKKQNAFNTAQTNYNTAETNKSKANDKLIPIEESYNKVNSSVKDASDKLDEVKNIAKGISDDKFKVVNARSIHSTSESTKITNDELEYEDVVTGRAYKLKTVNEMILEKSSDKKTEETGTGETELISEINGIIFYEKTDKNDQYNSGVMANVTGKDTNVIIQNEDESSNEIIAISKNESGIVKVDGGASLTYDAKTNYYTGGSLSESKVFDDEQLTISSEKKNYKVKFTGGTSNYLEREVKSIEAFNKYNADLKAKIKDKSSGLQDLYPTPEEMQEFYDTQINKLYKLVEEGSYNIHLKIDKNELEQAIIENGLQTEYENRVTKEDTDIGLDLTKDNYFIGVTGSNSTIEITDKAEITNGVKNDDAENPKSLISGGTVIKANFDDSGKTEQNTINIKGKISTAGSAITAKNASVNVFETGKIEGSITFDEVTNKDNQNKLTNLGSITGEISAKDTIIENLKTSDDVIGKIIGNITTTNDNVKIKNTGKIDGSITAHGDFTLNNTTSDSTNIKFGEDHIITGNIIAKDATSTIVNDKNATIIGAVTNYGEKSTFDNHGFVGGIYSDNTVKNTNDGEIINSTYKAVPYETNKGYEHDYHVIKLLGGSELKNDGDIYLGYYYLLDKDNNRINKYGYFIDENNNLVDNKGKIYDEDGSKSDEFGYLIDKNGNKKIKPIADAGNGNVSSANLGANGIKGIIDISVKGKDSKFANNKNIYLSESQVDTIVLQVENGGKYEDTKDSVISTFYNEKLAEKLHKNYGNQNKLVVSMDEGSKVTINGTVQLEDVGSIGLQSLNGGEIILNGIVNLFSHNLNDKGNRSTGLWAQGVADKGTSKLIMNGDSQVNIKSDSGIGVHIRSNSKVEINDNSSITFGSKNKDQIGFLISGIGSGDTAIAYNSDEKMNLDGINTVLFRIERGSKFSSDNSLQGKMKELNSNGTTKSTLLQFTTSPNKQDPDDTFNNEEDEKGKTIDEKRTVGEFGNFSLNVNGTESRGVAVEGGAHVTIIPQTDITISGNNNTLATIDNYYYDLHGETGGYITIYKESILKSAAILKSSDKFTATNSIGYHIKNGGYLEHLGQIDFTNQGNNNIGVKIESGGTLVSKVYEPKAGDSKETIDSLKESFIKVNGTAIEINGPNSTATVDNHDNCKIDEKNCYKPVVLAIGDENTNNAAAYRLNKGASLTLQNKGITKAQGTAHGILISDKGSKVILQNGAIIDLYAMGGYAESKGNGIENRSSSANSITFNNATINVKNGYGIHSSVGFSPEGAATGGTINVYGTGTGIQFEGIGESGEFTGSTDQAIINTGFESVKINVYGTKGYGIYVNSTEQVKTSASVNILNEKGNSALEVKGTTEKVTQSGNLYSASLKTPIVDLDNGLVNSFTNTGKILFGTFDENNSFTRLSDEEGSKHKAIEIETSGKEFKFTNNGEINGVISLKVTSPKGKSNTITLGANSVGNIFKTEGSSNKFIIEKVDGDDRGGTDQIDAFVSLVGGGKEDSITFKTGTKFTITKEETIKDIENFILEGKSKINLDLGDKTSDGFNKGTTSYNLFNEGSNLIYNWNKSNTNFNKTLKGKGTLTVNLNNDKNSTTNEFEFGTSDETNTKNFKGTLELTNTKYNLNDLIDDSNSYNNTSALKNATLMASDNSYIVVGAREQEIKGLNFNGGTVDFGEIDLDNEISANNIKLTDASLYNKSLLWIEKGNVKVDVDSDQFKYNPDVPQTLSILDQGSMNIYTQLVSADEVKGNSAKVIKVLDQNNDPVIDNIHSITQNNEEVARGTYGTTLITEDIKKEDNNKGLYLGYGLKTIELKVKNDKGNALLLDVDKSKYNTLDAKVTDYDNGDGTFSYGDLQISGTRAEVELKNSENDYHGSTYVQKDAKLLAGFNNSLGNTRLLQLNNGASFSLKKLEQPVSISIGSLETQENAKVDLNGGTLNITGIDGTQSNSNYLLTSNISANTLRGSGSLNFGKSVEESQNTKQNRSTQNNLQKLIVNFYGDNSDLEANVQNEEISTLELNSLAGLGNGEFTNQGTLNLNIDSSGELSNKAIYGDGTINKNGIGTLKFTLDQAGKYSGTVNINRGEMIFSGNSSSNNNTAYKLEALNIESGGTFVGLKNTNLSSTNILNRGTMYIGHDSSGNQTVNGDSVTVKNYTGESGSKLVFNGEMEGDDSIINKLIIKGDSNGSSLVKVNRIGGQGAKTVNGIVIIEVDGKSNAEFTLSDRVIAGAYEYKLCRVNDQHSCMNTNNSTIQTSKNFALYSDFATRTEMGGYIDNLYIANNLFNLRLHDRLGETQYTDLLTGEKKVTSMWLRTSYGYNKYQVANGDLNVKDNWNVTQIGGDIATWSDNTLNRFHLGVMAGKGGNSAKVKSSSTGLQSTTSLSGYSLGVYGTWYNNDRDKTGLYLDSWAMWNTFKNDVSGKEFSEKYHSKGLTASIESGYSFVAKKFNHYDFWLQPKGQITLQDVKEKERIEDNGTRIKTNYGNVQTRLGLRASLLSNKNDIKKQSNFSGQIFTEVNWLHNSKTYSVTTNDETTLSQDGAKNIGEIKFGLESNIKQKTNLWFNVSAQYGDYGYKNAAFTGGLKYSF